jgi:hypothetical protein
MSKFLDVDGLYMKDGRIRPGSTNGLANQNHGRRKEYSPFKASRNRI